MHKEVIEIIWNHLSDDDKKKVIEYVNKNVSITLQEFRYYDMAVNETQILPRFYASESHNEPCGTFAGLYCNVCDIDIDTDELDTDAEYTPLEHVLSEHLSDILNTTTGSFTVEVQRNEK